MSHPKGGKREDAVEAGGRASRPPSGRALGGRGKDVLDHLGDIITEAFRRSGSGSDKDAFTYIKAMMDDLSVASIQRSSKYLVRRVLDAMDLERTCGKGACAGGAGVVVEYGAADGVITRPVLQSLPPGAKLVAVERNPKLYVRLRMIDDPRLIPVNGDVRRIGRIVRGLGIGTVDAIVSGVPFSLFRPRARHEVLTQTTELLRDGGVFVAYQVTTHLIPLLADYFRRVETEFELRNIPPLFVFKASK
ncbi:MAG: hypothetical protein HY927_12860 [Elusimicrobia bacterium]|nr:hypothetical protein [Elusimicrobiota bacterium]